MIPSPNKPVTPPQQSLSSTAQQATTNTTIELQGTLTLPARTTPNGAPGQPRTNLRALLQQQIDNFSTVVNVTPLPTVLDFMYTPLPAPTSPLLVSELILMIADDLSPWDRLSLSRMSRLARFTLQGSVRQLLRAVRNAVQQAVANNNFGSVKDMFREIRLQNAHFLGRDQTLDQLRTAFGLRDVSRLQILSAFISVIPNFPPSRFARRDRQLECVYVARSLLQAIDARTPADLNRVVTSTLDILPWLHRGRHLSPAEYGGRGFARGASPFFDAGEVTCGLTVPAGLIVGGVAGAVAAAGSTVVREDKTTGRVINLAVEAMDRLLPGGLEDRTVQQITGLLVGAPGGKGKHLRKLHDAMTAKATEQQMASVRQQLHGAGWVPRPRGG